MRGAQVRADQRLLENSRFGKFSVGKYGIDGEFGEDVAKAVRRAKKALGFPYVKLAGGGKGFTSVMDDELRSYLKPLSAPGAKKLPPLYAWRRRQRAKAAAAAVAMRVKALNEAARWVGTKEFPADSNHVKFSDWYGIVGPWCAMFVTWCYVQAGSKTFKRGSAYAYCPYMVNDARAGRNGLSVTSDPLLGDVVLFDWDGGVADHVGLFDKWLDRKAGVFATIEGNTSLGNDSNGGAVMRRTRYLSQVECFVRVGG